MRLVFLAAAFILTSLQLFSQDFKPKAVATPEQASLGKFGSIDVSNYTGTANISLPLHSIGMKGMEIPIVLRYHPSGIQVEQEATWVGLGWDLSVGGSITQIIQGKLDQEDNVSMYADTYNALRADLAGIGGYPNMEYATLNQFVCTSEWGCTGQTVKRTELLAIRDQGLGQPDIYAVNLPTGSFTFYLDPITHVPVQFGKKDQEYTIEKSTTTTQYQSEWTIKDYKGNTFFFSRNDNEYSNNTNTSSYYNSFTSKLTSITLPGGKIISFTYTNGKYENNTFTQSKFYDNHDGVVQNYTTVFNSVFNVKYLSAIETETEKVTFDLSNTEAERLDLKGHTIAGGYGAKRINAIYIWDKINNKKVGGYELSYSYYGYDALYPGFILTSTDALTKRLKLNSVREIGYTATGVAVTTNPPYVFGYNEAVLLPRKDAYARDHWGYFNGQQGNTSYLPNLTNDFHSSIATRKDFLFNPYPNYVIEHLKAAGQANKGMEPTSAKSCILNKITYPTGGYTGFEYEPHKFNNYRIFSAQEINSGEGIINANVVDMNTSGSTLVSAPLYPDANGLFTISNFKPSITRINTSINSSHFLNARIRLKKTSGGVTTLLNEYYLTTQDLPQFEAANTFNFGPFNMTINGLSSDYYTVEAYLPDIPELTPSSSIPVATAGAIFAVPDHSTKLKVSIGGGLRIASVTNMTQAGSFADKKVYKYLSEDELTTSGKIMTPVINYAYFKHFSFFDQPQYNGDPPGEVHQYVPQDAEVYSVQSYSYVPFSQDAQGEGVGYSRVKILSVDAGNIDEGSTVYKYKNTPSYYSESVVKSFGKAVPNIVYYDNGLPELVKYYKKNQSLPLKEVTYQYSTLASQTKRYEMIFNFAHGVTANIKCGKFCTSQGECDYQIDPCFINTNLFPNGKWLSIIYPLNMKWYVLSSETNTDYSDDHLKQVSNQKTYNYNALGQVIKEEYLTSTGDTKQNLFTYPNDVVAPPTIVQLMKTKKLYHLPILQQSNIIKSSVTQELSRTNYNYLQTLSANINVSNITKSILSGTAFDVVSNLAYDGNDNVIQFEKSQQSVSYLWDFLNSYKIAEAENAAVSEIAYCSFEADGKGNWAFSGSPVTSVIVPPTGKSFYSLSSGMMMTASGLNAGKNYILSYWSMDGMQTVSNTISTKTGSTYNGWTYYQHTINGASSYSLSGTGRVDEVRFYPAEARLKTYTYSPLIGVTSVCEANNMISYYEYDNYRRLTIIRDQGKNVLKKICYNYSGQVIDCSSPCSNTTANWQNTLTPLRCQQTTPCNYTGYQEQEQKDLNTCSPTYNQTQWVVAGYNPTACANNNVSITYSTFNTPGFTITYTNSVTSQVYTFSIPGSGSGVLGCIPAGTYAITITKPLNSTVLYFNLGCLAMSGTSASFGKVRVSATACNQIHISLPSE